jgi:hypothetical protein
MGLALQNLEEILKHKSQFDESRPVMFRRLYDDAYEELHGRLFKEGRNVGTWGDPGVRSRVRKLARETARVGMKQIRHGVQP